MLRLAARHGRLCLVLGLVAGIALPGLALAVRPWLPLLIGSLLLLTAFRIGARAAVGGLSDLGGGVARVLTLQVAMPLGLLAAFLATGTASHPLALAMVLMLSAPSVTGTPNFTLMLGHDPAPAMRLLILGTALLPLTVLPIMALSPMFADRAAVVEAALRLLAVILGAVSLGFALRAAFRWPTPPPAVAEGLDGATAILLGVLVIGLMSAVGPTLQSAPLTLAAWLAVACLANLGLQAAAYAIERRAGRAASAVPLAIVTGNRNIALFLVALPPAATDPLLVFIGCYQIPMFLTPILMRRLYRPLDPPGRSS